MVDAGDPEGLEPLHPFHSDHDILQRVVQRMAQVERAGHVRRRDDDRIRLLFRIGGAVKETFLFPIFRPAFLCGEMVVLFRQFIKKILGCRHF